MYQSIGVVPFVIGRQCMYTVTLTLEFHLIQPAESGIVLRMGSNRIVVLFLHCFQFSVVFSAVFHISNPNYIPTNLEMHISCLLCSFGKQHYGVVSIIVPLELFSVESVDAAVLARLL